ncbi:MAG: cytochrome oxidase assembly protein [Planctomycetota bacterium]|nr:MAG: cytochrome oxidase assembly protein [Planctomycetota bacterium]
MADEHADNNRRRLRRANRIAWALAIMVFPLIWMGGLVTTYNAGMAVPDWPNTYGYNLFLYPIESWLKTWDVFLEHSHRLIGATVGFLAIALVVALWRHGDRRYRWWALGVLAAVSAQGVLGGIRVIGREMLLADIHGCTAPLVFAACAWMVMATSARWSDRSVWESSEPSAARARLAGWPFWLLAVTTYCQIVLGAQVRHLFPTLPVLWGTLWVWLHVGVGLSLVLLWGIVRRVVGVVRGECPFLVRRVNWFLGLYIVQLLLGAGTWVTNYNWPRWFTNNFVAVPFTVRDGGMLQATTTTAHVAVGSLLLIAAFSAAVWASRRRVFVEPEVATSAKAGKARATAVAEKTGAGRSADHKKHRRR